MQKIKTSDWVINPVFVFLILWSMQIIGHVVFWDSFDPFVTELWWILAAGVCGFLLGCLLLLACYRCNKDNNFSKDINVPRFIDVYLKFLLPAYIFLVAFPEIFNLISHSDLSLAEIRAELVNSVVENDRSVVIILYVHYLVVLASLLSLAYASKLKRRMICYVAVLGLVAGVLTFGRTILLLYFVSFGTILYFQGLISKRVFFVIGLVFVVTFFAMAYFMNKGGIDDGLFENVVWNFKVYILGGLSAFNNYVSTGEPDIPGLLLMPNFAKELLSGVGILIESTPNFLPFVETPLPTNVYTAIFPWYHDGGILGVFFGFCVMGFVSMFLFEARYNSRMNLFLYSISIYPLLMLIFEEQYLRAYTLWVLVLLLVAAVNVIDRFKFYKMSGWFGK